MLESESGDRRTEEANAEKGMSHLSGFDVWLSDAAGARVRCLVCHARWPLAAPRRLCPRRSEGLFKAQQTRNVTQLSMSSHLSPYIFMVE